MSRKIGVSIVCMVPWSLWQNGLGRAIIMAHDAGFDGLQILPMRGWNQLTFPEIPKEKIISCENAWNYGSFWGAVLRRFHIAGEDKPLFKDWALFGDEKSSQYVYDLICRKFPNSLMVSHDLYYRAFGPLELNPEMEISVPYERLDCSFVWDTEHVVRSGRHGERPVTDNWERLLDKIGHNIKLIHVKSSADPKMLKALAKETDCPVIFEDRPPFGKIFRPPLKDSKDRMIAWLKDRRTFLSYFFD